MDKKDTQRWKGVLDVCLLALIAQRPRYGFELIPRLEEMGLLALGEGSIYPLLSRMQNGGLIEAFVLTSEETARKHKYYSILPGGEEKLREYEQEWMSLPTAVRTPSWAYILPKEGRPSAKLVVCLSFG